MASSLPTTRPWEQYYREGEKKAPGTVDRMLFQARDQRRNRARWERKGFLIDNVTVTSSVN